MSFVQCGNGVHHYRVSGDLSKEPLLVFINGLGTDHRIWDRVLEALPAQLATLVYDLRGQGLSELGADRYDVAALSDDLELLLQRLGARSVLPIGFSMGGLVAQQFALAHPARVRGLVLCATAARIGSAESWGERAEAVRRGGLAAVADAVIKRWFSDSFRATGSGSPVISTSSSSRASRSARRSGLNSADAMRSSSPSSSRSA